MRAYQLKDSGLEALSQVELPAPEPGPGQVLVKVRAVSLNYRDLLVARNQYGRSPITYPLIPLSDAAGEVVETGVGVNQLRMGDRVIGNFFQKWYDGPFDRKKGASALGGAIDGVLSEFVVFDASASVAIPPSLSFEEASTLPCAGLTAWVGLVSLGELVAGQSILAMGTGGVSVFALQIAKRHGARVIVTSSLDAKLERARALGADELINYLTQPEWDERARELTLGHGVDQLLEVGGKETVTRSLNALREGGHLALIGLLTGSFPDAKAVEGNARGVRVSSVYVGSAQQLREFCTFIEKTSLYPVIDRVYPFEQAAEAYRFLESGQHFGKIVIRL